MLALRGLVGGLISIPLRQLPPAPGIALLAMGTRGEAPHRVPSSRPAARKRRTAMGMVMLPHAAPLLLRGVELNIICQLLCRGTYQHFDPKQRWVRRAVLQSQEKGQI